MGHIEIIEASRNNLKNISLVIPKKQLIAVTGVSGSGKSTLAYHTLFQEGQRKYLESLSVHARQLLKSVERPQVRFIRGIAPTISVDQKHSAFHYNSTAGTVSGISQYLRLLFAGTAGAVCPKCGKDLKKYGDREIGNVLGMEYAGRLVRLLAPVVRNRRGGYEKLLQKYLKRGFLKARIDGNSVYLDMMPELDRNRRHSIELQVDALEMVPENSKRFSESLALALDEGNGEIIVQCGDRERFFSTRLYCADCGIGIPEPQPATFSLNSPLGACQECGGRGTDNRGQACPACSGSGYSEGALLFRFQGHNIFEMGELESGELLHLLKSVKLSPRDALILKSVYPQILQRLQAFSDLNLDYLKLNRRAGTLSGGELQRVRLVSQVGFCMSGIIYILDEPSIGLHMSEQQNLIRILNSLKRAGNTVVVVEHDELTIRAADYVVDLGPGAGESGGKVTFAGWFKDFRKAGDSVTARCLFEKKDALPAVPEAGTGTEPLVKIRQLKVNNVNGADLTLFHPALTVVTGVSGSGKSSLMLQGICPLVRRKLNSSAEPVRDAGCRTLQVAPDLGRIMVVDQKSMGSNARSCPATYIGIMPLIRELYAGLTEAKIRGYTARRFSFNVAGGRCEACKGTGMKRLEMSFLPRLEVDCPVCGGNRYHSETLQVRYRGLSIADLLDQTAVQALAVFRNVPHIADRLKVMVQVGLGYLKLGQSLQTLSGGESQRIKLTRELGRTSGKTTLYVLDEPTVGLHIQDVRRLTELLRGLISGGNSVVVIEHNPDIIRAADYIVDMGPGGGKRGGKIMFQGQADQFYSCSGSVTAEWLKKNSMEQ